MVLVGSLGLAFAEPLAKPKGAPVLKVLGAGVVASPGKVTVFDLEMLRALPQTHFETSTVWTEGVTNFTGVSLKDFAESLGITSGTLVMTAVNDYAAEVPLADAVEGGPILAYMMDGKIMSVRDKGPIWLVYPYDGHPAYQTEVIYARSIWQLVTIEIVP